MVKSIYAITLLWLGFRSGAFGINTFHAFMPNDFFYSFNFIGWKKKSLLCIIIAYYHDGVGHEVTIFDFIVLFFIDVVC